MPKILLVEDEEILREAFTIILSTLPYEAETAPDGATALSMCQESTYDIIFLDLMMPVMNGVEFLDEFRETVASSNESKVIILSNLSSSILLEQAKKRNIHSSILKSDVSPGSLVHLIREELKTPTSAKA